jgi:DNA-binding transcriptional regulator YiaG
MREGRGLSQEAFAALIGVDPSTLAGWEHGRRRPSRHPWRRLSLFEGSED